jgi:hypothetical protein
MRRLLTEKSRPKCDEILRVLLNHGDKEVRAWAEHKKTPWILAGISRSHSKMSPATFDSHRRDTNLIESTHHHSNQGGIGVSLLNGIKQ